MFCSIQNFDLKTFTFDLFGTKAAKRKLPILKDRGFDIATINIFRVNIAISKPLPTSAVYLKDSQN